MTLEPEMIGEHGGDDERQPVRVCMRARVLYVSHHHHNNIIIVGTINTSDETLTIYERTPTN